MSFKKATFALLLAALVPVAANATTLQKPAGNQNKQAASDFASKRVDSRIASQQQRIESGKSSGKLTQNEANRLQKREDKIVAATTKARADGNLTRGEASRINNMQNRQQKAIANQTNDRQRAKTTR